MKVIQILSIIATMAALTSCAPGSFVSGYSYRSVNCDHAAMANGLDPVVETRIVNRAKAEMKLEINK